jgi:Diguanylate cyclase, GGDEF domain
MACGGRDSGRARDGSRHDFGPSSKTPRTRPRRRGRDGPHRVAVVLVDLDDFKRIDDRAGHTTGDAVLREVAMRIPRLCAPSSWPTASVARSFSSCFPTPTPTRASLSDSGARWLRALPRSTRDDLRRASRSQLRASVSPTATCSTAPTPPWTTPHTAAVIALHRPNGKPRARAGRGCRRDLIHGRPPEFPFVAVSRRFHPVVEGTAAAASRCHQRQARTPTGEARGRAAGTRRSPGRAAG